MRAKLFTKEELKRIKYIKMKEGMNEKEAEEHIAFLIRECRANHAITLKRVYRLKAKRKPKKKILLLPSLLKGEKIWKP